MMWNFMSVAECSPTECTSTYSHSVVSFAMLSDAMGMSCARKTDFTLPTSP
eukprot:m.69268 g.69268  ORF g.69268 m.69268 type:complete len:51 (+) comp16023_c0_seq5:857-1009(+)